jgi:hypothetical protein
MKADNKGRTWPGLKEEQQQPGETLNAYELRQQRRRERLQDAAERAQQSAEANRKTADRMASVIPFGQPILVGHYSENADRRYRARIHGHMGKWIAETKRAEELERKAASVGTGGISSDDPSAVSKLQAQLAGLEAYQERMKAGNRIMRDKSLTDEQKVEKLVAIGLTHENAWRALKPDFCGRVGFPDYALQNNSGNMRRIRERIEQLGKRSEQTAEAPAITGQRFPDQRGRRGQSHPDYVRRQAARSYPRNAQAQRLALESDPHRMGSHVERSGPSICAIHGTGIEQGKRGPGIAPRWNR